MFLVAVMVNLAEWEAVFQRSEAREPVEVGLVVVGDQAAEPAPVKLLQTSLLAPEVAVEALVAVQVCNPTVAPVGAILVL